MSEEKRAPESTEDNAPAKEPYKAPKATSKEVQETGHQTTCQSCAPTITVFCTVGQTAP